MVKLVFQEIPLKNNNDNVVKKILTFLPADFVNHKKPPLEKEVHYRLRRLLKYQKIKQKSSQIKSVKFLKEIKKITKIKEVKNTRAKKLSDFKTLGVGVDIEEIERFEKYNTKDNPFVLRIFTKNEIEYCFSKKNYASHLAARYCAKEACLKAVCSFGYEAVSYADFEIYHRENGAPEVRITSPMLNEKVELKISLSHSKTNAICYALAHKKHVPINCLGENIYGNSEI